MFRIERLVYMDDRLPSLFLYNILEIVNYLDNFLDG
jgi:hypothetical protein